MTNKLKLSILLVFAGGSLFAQQGRFKLGLRFAPGVSMTRVQDINENDTATYASSSAGLRFSAGLSGDFYFGRNYAVYSGLWYSVMKAGVKSSFDKTGQTSTAQSEVNIQNLQIPVALKFFTNEIATDAKLYFVLGGTGSLAIKKIELEENILNSDHKFVRNSAPEAYSFGDIGLLLGAGVEYRLGESTALFGGLSYNRGLTDVATKKGPLNRNFVSKSLNASDLYHVSLSMISLEMGVYF